MCLAETEFLQCEKILPSQTNRYQEEREKKTTARGVPKRSPIQVLTAPGAA